jgi:carbohydrate-binding DOMON domain-containing protein
MSWGQKCILSITLLLFLTTFYTAAQAEKSLIYSTVDPGDDDHGPGYYLYPEHEVFQQKEGIFDLIEFKIYEEDAQYEFQFEFTNIIDVWNSRFGFSMPMIQIYIDNEKGGSIALFEEGAQVKLNPEYPWDKLLKINGWWISLYVPQDRNKKVVDFTVSGEDVPWMIKDPAVEVKKDWIKLKIDKDKVGPLQGANLFILVGGFDPFGYDHFRGVRNELNSWFFAAEGEHDINYAPRVIDLVVPPEYSQEEMLDSYQIGYAQIEPIHIGNDNSFEKKDYYVYIVMFIIFSVSIYFSIKIIKRRLGVNRDAQESEQAGD